MNSKADFLAALKDREYWDNRQRKLIASIERDETKLSKKLNKIYKEEAARLKRLIASYYSQYGRENVIEYRELLKTLPPEEAEMLIKDIDRYFNEHPEQMHLFPIRASVYKLDRLEGLGISLQVQQFLIADIETKLLQKHLEMVFNKSFLDSMDLLGQGARVNRINTNLAKKFVNKTWIDGHNLSEKIYNNRNKVATHLKTEFRNSVIRGDSYADAAERITKKFTEVSQSNAMRLIRTEGTYMLNEGAISPFENEFDEYEYSAILDSRTSEICKALNGRKFKMKDRQAGVNFPPMHPWCRSTFRLVVDDDYIEKKTKEIVENGKNEK